MMRNLSAVFVLLYSFLAFVAAVDDGNSSLQHRQKDDDERQLQTESLSSYQQRLGRRRTQNFFQVPPEDQQWQECVDQMYASDVNGDLQLGEVEYTLFVATRTRGQILVDQYRNLPFSLISCFVYGACFCGVFSFVPDCCVGEEAHIELNTESSQFISGNLITLCRSVDDAIQQEIGTLAPVPVPPPIDEPTPVTTASPSMVPSSSPSVIVSDSPSMVPSTQPTVSSTDVPTLIISTAPSTIPSDTPSSVPSAVSTDVPSNDPTMETMSKLNFCLVHRRS